MVRASHSLQGISNQVVGVVDGSKVCSSFISLLDVCFLQSLVLLTGQTQFSQIVVRRRILRLLQGGFDQTQLGRPSRYLDTCPVPLARSFQATGSSSCLKCHFSSVLSSEYQRKCRRCRFHYYSSRLDHPPKPLPAVLCTHLCGLHSNASPGTLMSSTGPARTDTFGGPGRAHPSFSHTLQSVKSFVNKKLLPSRKTCEGGFARTPRNGVDTPQLHEKSGGKIQCLQFNDALFIIMRFVYYDDLFTLPH